MPDKKAIIKSVLLGPIVSLVITIILLCIITVVQLKSGLLPVQAVNIATIIMLALGTFFGSFIAARIAKSGGLIIGAITGFLVFVVVTVTALVHSSDTISVITFIKFLSEIIFGGVGGIIGVNKKEKLHIK